MDDDRRFCTSCRNLMPARENGERFCAAARRGELAHVGQSRDYRPYFGHPCRCVGYLPLPDEPDQRSGAERWPSLVVPFVKKLCWPREYRYRVSPEQVVKLYADAEQEAKFRRPYNDPNYMSEESEYVGLAGEAELCAFLGLTELRRVRDRKGDGGWDAEVRGTKIDAKAARHPNDLTHPKNVKFGSSIYVLCGYDDAFRQAVLLGWAYAGKLKEAPIKEKRGSDGKPGLRYCLDIDLTRRMAEWPKDLYA